MGLALAFGLWWHFSASKTDEAKASSPLGKAKEKVKERLAKISPTMKKLAGLTGVAGVGLAAAYAGGYRLFNKEGEKPKDEVPPKDVAGKALFYGEKALNYTKAKPYHVGGVAAAIVTPFLLWRFLPAKITNKLKSLMGKARKLVGKSKL